MNDSLPIDEVVRLTGLTSRALRFYEARGLVSPLRTHAGRRWYGPTDLERINQVVALKKAGLSLGDIKRLFDRKPVDLPALLQVQRIRLAEQAQDVANAITLIDSALSRIGRGEPLDAATLCSLIRDGDQVMKDQTQAWQDVVNTYYTPEEQANWQEHMADAPEFSQQAYIEKWKELSGRIESALPLDPASDEALAFVREWFALLEPFSRNATPEMWAGAIRLYENMDAWEGKVDAGFSQQIWEFISQAASAARRAGKDVGPLPPWMESRP